MSGLILAIDQGTTNTKALVVAADGRVLHKASVANHVDYPRPGWAEQSMAKLFGGVAEAIAEVLRQLGDPGALAGIAISNQRESVLIWDGVSGEPVGPCITWQCRRSAPACQRLREQGHEERIAEKTGLPLDPLFPAAKIAWLLDDNPGARGRASRGEIRAGTIDSWLLWNLTGGGVHATDVSNASRTQLFNTGSLDWDDELCEIFDVPRAMLPEVRPSDAEFGRTAAGATALPPGIPIRAMIGDSHAALYGHGVRQPGAVKATYGTGTSLMTLTDSRVRSGRGLSSTIAWGRAGTVSYALEGNISVSGQAASFMAELLGVRDATQLSELAETVPDGNGVTFVPALMGLGAPYWRADARGTITGMSLGTRPAHLARAALESIAFQVGDVFIAMQSDIGTSLTELRADGGASQNPMLMQFQADLIAAPVAAAAAPEVSALGAAAMAFAGMGVEIPAVEAADRFQPRMQFSEREVHRARWTRAVAQTLVAE